MAKIEKGEIVFLNRSQIKLAEYNPRKISTSAREKLKRGIRKHGVVQPFVVNSRTGNTLISGHQRLSILDEIEKFSQDKDYPVRCLVIDCDKEEEVKLNVLLNNQSVMGEFDIDLLAEIRQEFPDIDFVRDFGFDRADLDFFFSQSEFAEEIFQDAYIEKPTMKADVEKLKKLKKDLKAKQRQLLDEGESHLLKGNDYQLLIVFNTNSEKAKFMSKIGKKGRAIPYSQLYDFLIDEAKI